MNLTRLIRAALIAAGAELAGLALMATAAWLLLRAAEQPPLAALTVAIVAVRTLALLRGGLRYAERLTGHEVVLRYVSVLRTRVYRSLVPQRYSSGDLVDRLVSDVDAAQDAVLRCLLPAAVAGLVGVTAVAATSFASIGSALALLGGLLVAGVVLPLCAMRTPARRTDLANHTVELITGRRELIAYDAHAPALAAAHEVVEALARRDRTVSARNSFLSALGILTQLGTAVAVCLLAGASAPVTAAVTLGTITAFEVVLPLTAAAQRWVEVRESATRIRTLLAGRPAPRAAKPVTTGHFRLEKVSVQYPGRAPALVDVDLDLPPGKRVGLVGPSGSGKSTLLHTLLGLTDPTGWLTVDGHPLEDRDLPPLISGALADAHVFHTTVRENLLLARPNATEDDLRSACEVTDLDVDLDRDAGPDGDALSGGQRQRLILARAVLAAPPVLVLDEPVEGLDTAHGDAVLAAVLAQATGTVVLATHRPEHLAGFDEVLYLDEGRIVRREATKPATAA
ncbi:ATP-binding cassette, subfamily C, CydC [Amycolatopsis xylanica]|uniref:ATP-binding cassette, subfamily C, CydC n=1 Tax=Amycolatopsis xylanica TaxID=589385 RepID=A0A1H3MB28_9PSEU|nr:thiol reductant ABC exporter subunit CydC [Amycolatopsis xylanica]SDY73920.1 ATP-binding cassette, subfamily C, CydC [Amycolatopsis xylanica]